MPDAKIVKIQINGKALEVKAGTPVIQAAEEAGVFIPRYCYHPDLSIAGVCRMCVCEIEKNPRLQISCNTMVAEGMVIRTDTPKVKDAVKSALELHLINHPLDCPICDKAGECKLQDFYADFGLYQSRMEYDAKNHKPKAQDIGTIMLDSERCILCTRCVRFTAEVTKSYELGIFNRGDRSELRTYDKGPLRNDYTGNLADICPVGALTAKDFRFAQRVWFLDKASSICTLCSRGCNTTVSVNPQTKKLYRVEPRRNTEVNSSWICDQGRWGYHYVSDETRLKNPKTRVNGNVIDATWEAAFQVMAQAVQEQPKKILVGLSTQLTNEEILDLVGTFKGKGIENFTWLVDEKVVGEKAPYDQILRHRDSTPNAAGFEWVMQGEKWLKQSEALLQAQSFDWIWLFGLEGHDHSWWPGFASRLPKTAKLFVHTTSDLPLWESAQWIVPNTSAYEKTGTMVSILGRLQKVNPALPAQYTSRDGHSVAFGIEKGNDRTPMPAGRAQTFYENVVLKKLSSAVVPKWRGFEPKGVALKESTSHAQA